MRPDDFYVDHPDPLGLGGSTRTLDIDLLTSSRRGPVNGHDDVEVAVALARLVHDDLERYGTDSSQEMTEYQMQEAILALSTVVNGPVSPISPCRFATTAPSRGTGCATVHMAHGAGDISAAASAKQRTPAS